MVPEIDSGSEKKPGRKDVMDIVTGPQGIGDPGPERQETNKATEPQTASTAE
jgi:hypothetical protein